MEILKLRTPALQNDEHFAFFTEFIGFVNEAGADALKIGKPFDAFKTLFADEDEALKKILKSNFTRLIHDADVERDTVFSGLAEANRTALKHFKPAIREAAIRLQIIFDTYGNVAQKSIDAETSAVQNLLGELTRNHAADMTTVGLNEWAEELRRLNEKVWELTVERDEETSAGTTVVLRRVRLEMDEIYRRMITRIEAFSDYDEEEHEDDDFSQIPPGELKLKAAKATSPYAPFIAKLNAAIERYNNRIAIRKGKAAKKSESESGLKD
jgi:hypothetical protein